MRFRAGAGFAAILALALAVGAGAAEPARRVVSLNPSLSETLVALGAVDTLVGVDDDSARRLAPVRALPTVGGLFNPSLEAIVALEPDLVVMVPSVEQNRLRERLAALGVPVLVLPNIRLDELLASIEALGARVGRPEAAAERVAAIRRAFAEETRASAARPPVRTVLVLQRDPLFLVGGGSWIDAMLQAAGAANLGAELEGAYPRVGVEWLVAARPELLLDASEDAQDPQTFWARWPSLGAEGRVQALDGDLIRPGPYLDRSLRRLAEAIRGPAS